VYWEFDRPRLEPNPPATSWATTIPASSNREAAAATEAEFAAGPSWHAYAPSRAAPLDDAVARPSIASHPYEVPARGPVPGRLTGGPITGWAGLPRNAAGVQDSRPAAHAIAQALDRFLLAAVVLVVALCAVGIMAAEASPQANHVILSVAHVDIRASLSHLMAWLRGLRS
jgi:hypothetical protein